MASNTFFARFRSSQKVVTGDHAELSGRDAADQHPIEAITGLVDALNAKADADTVYTKGEADALIAEKADASDVYTKQESDAALDLKANAADTYTKAETDEAIEEAVAGSGKAFVATYNVTTAQEIIAYLEGDEPFAPVLVKRGSDYFAALIIAKRSESSLYLRVLGSISGNYYVFEYTITNATWATSTHGLQKALVSGESIKTINGESLLGSGNIDIQGGGGDYQGGNGILISGKTIYIDESVVATQEDLETMYRSIAADMETKQDILDPIDGIFITVSNQIGVDSSIIATVQALNAGLDTKADKSNTYTKTEVDALIPDVSDFVTDAEMETALDAKADKATTYNKTEVDALIPDVSGFATETELTDGLATKADAATTYTKAEVDALIPDVSDFVTDTEMQTALLSKADAATTYTKTEMDALLGDKLEANDLKTIDNQSIVGNGNLSVRTRTLWNEQQRFAILQDLESQIDIGFSQESANTLRIQESAPDSRGNIQTIFDEVLPNKSYVDNAVAGVDTMQHIEVGQERLIGDWTEDGVTYDYYEKVVPLGPLPNGTAQSPATITVAHGITNKVRFVDTIGKAYGGNNLSIPFVNASGSLFIYMGVGNSLITITANSDRSSLNGYAYLRFIRNKA